MATTTWNGITVPAGTDLYNLAPDLKTLAESATVIVPVASEVARDAVAAATTPSATNPLYVHRADAAVGSELEVSEDGTNWAALVTSTDVTASLSLAAGSFISAGGWNAIKTGRTVTLVATFDTGAGWAGGAWASKNMMVIPAALMPVRETTVAWPFYGGTVGLTADTSGNLKLVTSTGGVAASLIIRATITWVTA